MTRINTTYHLRLQWALMMFTVLCIATQGIQAAPKTYQCEFGLQGGLGYYVGDATSHVFQNIRESYGAQFRYKFDPRWALQVKGLAQTITGPMFDNRIEQPVGDGTRWTNSLINLDVAGEFNFLRFGETLYDTRLKPYSPYIFLGIGMTLHNEYHSVAAYLPVGIGFKWKFAPRWGLNIAWQHNIYFADNLEGIDELANTHDMNGSNIMNCDVTSQLTLGLVFEFAQQKKVCPLCKY